MCVCLCLCLCMCVYVCVCVCVCLYMCLCVYLNTQRHPCMCTNAHSHTLKKTHTHTHTHTNTHTAPLTPKRHATQSRGRKTAQSCVWSRPQLPRDERGLQTPRAEQVLSGLSGSERWPGTVIRPQPRSAPHWSQDSDGRRRNPMSFDARVCASAG